MLAHCMLEVARSEARQGLCCHALPFLDACLACTEHRAVSTVRFQPGSQVGAVPE